MLTVLASLTLISHISGEDKVESEPTTVGPRLNKGFKPKFVRILTQDEVSKSNVNDNNVPRKFVNKHKNRGSRYGGNSPIQMIIKVEEVPIHKVKPFVSCKSR